MVVEPESSQTEVPNASPGLPRAFGNYLLFDSIGRGGMAEIFLARLTTEFGAARRVVVKEILPELSSDPAFTRLLVTEAKLAARLSHRNIVKVIDLGRESGRLFIAMEYVEGYDLNQLLRQLSRRRLPLPAQFALLVVREVLAALDYAHRAADASGAPLAVVHRDVSPSNVLVSFEGEVSLCDFGIAHALQSEISNAEPLPQPRSSDESRIQRVGLTGKSAYMAPEHARGKEVDARSDLFAVGILLWELCAGRRLYKGTDQEMLDMARRGVVPPLPERGLPSAPKLQAILDRALCVDPALRYQSAVKMLEDLDDYAASTQLLASQLRFATFLTENFAQEIVALRHARERAAEGAQLRPPVEVAELEPVPKLSELPLANPSVAPVVDARPKARLDTVAPVQLKAAEPELAHAPTGSYWPLLVVLAAVAATALVLFALR